MLANLGISISCLHMLMNLKAALVYDGSKVTFDKEQRNLRQTSFSLERRFTDKGMLIAKPV